jgi:hypothetical protein
MVERRMEIVRHAARPFEEVRAVEHLAELARGSYGRRFERSLQ